MELSLESLGTFRPKTGSMEDWNAAYDRVKDSLRAHRIHNPLHQSRLIQTSLDRAAARHEKSPYLDPTILASEEAERLMNEWFTELVGERDLPAERVAAAGRVALLLADGPQKWPYAFLDDQNIPPDFFQAVKKSSLKAGQHIQVSSSEPRHYDLRVIHTSS